MNKRQALEKWGAATKLYFRTPIEEWKQVFPDKETLVEFWNDVKGICWPENCGQEPWGLASDIAYTVAENPPLSWKKQCIGSKLKSSNGTHVDDARREVELYRAFGVELTWQYEVTDCEFNRRWAPDLIGQKFDRPPSYANVNPDHS